MRTSLSIALATICLTASAASAQTIDGQPVQLQPPPQSYMQAPPPGYVQPPVAVQQYCQPYTDSFVMGGEKRITRGTACLQPNGAWELHPAQAAVRYVTQGNTVFIVPYQPFSTVIIEGHHHHRY